ncbi:hypothetical protein CRI93_09505 [Longimonas halophila]|uniref:Glycosyl transferase family 1 domain-containing protein n=1 Tax=Longimonas halophila TaxID=1469170 RepID=A0A2H3NKI0_9BACT|nr:glycosyltransferase family 4 protein [Longimonas halophila]PEN06508.1 hypothetical protein CRI93_09505 [Longimonas halophila]
MKILTESRAFYPSVGGLEMMAEGLSTTWQKRGHNVRVITATPLHEQKELEALDVIRQPSTSEWIQQLRWADVFFQNGVSLRSLGYPLIMRCPIVYRHPNLLTSNKDGFDLPNQLKRWATHLGYNIASCQAVANTILGPAEIVPNTFRPIFDREGKSDSERQGLLFVGRLVHGKGIDIALDALYQLHQKGKCYSLTICGGGKDRELFKKRTAMLGLAEDVTFVGWTDSKELSQKYAHASAVLVPSRYEAFGIVALEAIACGCPVVASNVGGLPESVGECGILVESENPAALAEGIEKALNPAVRSQLRDAMPAHIARHRINRVADAYLEVIERYVEEVS